TQNPAQHVAATLVRWKNAIREEKCHRSAVIRDDAKGCRLSAAEEGFGLPEVSPPRPPGFAALRGALVSRAALDALVTVFDGLLDRFDQGEKDIGVEIVRFSLHDRGDALEAGSGID